MKKTLALFMFVFAALAVFAQTNAPVDPSLPPLPTDKGGFWDLAIAAVTPILVWLVTLVAPKVPKVLLPCITPLVGIGLGVALNKLAGADLSWYDMGKAGALAVFIREVVNQAITKRLSGDSSATSQ